jgi:hypothetical protein
MLNFTEIFNKLAINGRNYDSNENGALQPNVNGLLRSPSDVLTSEQGGHLVNIFVKAIRKAPESVINDSVNQLLCSSSKENVVIIVDALLRQLCMTRHIRESGGKGEREQSYIFIKALIDFVPDVMVHILPVFIPLTGYYKDYVVLIDRLSKDVKYRDVVQALITGHCQSICYGDFLAAKWAPSEGTQYDEIAKLYAKKLYPEIRSNNNRLRAYRKLLTSIRSGKFLVEAKMSSRDWTTVAKNLSAVPAAAQQKYKKAFVRQISEAYQQFLLDVKNGKVKLNVVGLQIDTIIKQLFKDGNAIHGSLLNKSLSEEELLLLNITWNKIEDEVVQRMVDDEEFFNCFRKLTVIDQSGSMMGGPDRAAIALGLFTARAIGRAERARFGKDYIGFGDAILRFAEQPNAIKLMPTENISDYLQDFMTQSNRFACGFSTDMEKVHQLVIQLTQESGSSSALRSAPGLLILTDMQYNGHGFNVGGKITHDEIIDRMYRVANIDKGEVFCWNLRGDTNTFQSEADKTGVQMIGGFNQSMLNLFFEGKRLVKDSVDKNKKSSTWDTFVAAQAHYNCVSEWLQDLYSKIEITNEMRVKYPVQALFLENLPRDYVSMWTIDESNRVE